MLHYSGNITAMALGHQAKEYIWMYHKAGEDICLVPYMDLVKNKKRFVKFDRLNDQWCFTDLVD